jgi:hypothetical protein
VTQFAAGFGIDSESKTHTMIERGWYYATLGANAANQPGPCTDLEMVDLIAQGMIAREQLVWHATKSQGRWVRADLVPAFCQLFDQKSASAPPYSTPVTPPPLPASGISLGPAEPNPFAAPMQGMSSKFSMVSPTYGRDIGFQCPFCSSTHTPHMTEQISVGGWVLFAVILFLCWPLCWIPLIAMKEMTRTCSSCGIKLG